MELEVVSERNTDSKEAVRALAYLSVGDGVKFGKSYLGRIVNSLLLEDGLEERLLPSTANDIWGTSAEMKGDA